MIVFNSSSVYQLFQFLLLTNKDEDRLYIVGEQFNKSILNNIKDKTIVLNYLDTKIREKNKLTYLIKYFNNLRKLRKEFKKVSFIKNTDIYGFSLISPYFYKNGNRIIGLEDGAGNYVDRSYKNLNFKQKILDILNYLFFGYSGLLFIESTPIVKKIYLSNPHNIPNSLKHKAEILDIKKLWKQKSKDEKKWILEIFNFKENFLTNLKKRNYILYTQPLSEEKFLETEQEKIEVYEKIINKYNSHKIVIKPHPRETTDYKKYFKDVEVLDSGYPSQLLEVLDINFEKSITLFSTAVLNLKNTEIVWFGTKINQNLLKKLGNLPIEKFKGYKI